MAKRRNDRTPKSNKIKRASLKGATSDGTCPDKNLQRLRAAAERGDAEAYDALRRHHWYCSGRIGGGPCSHNLPAILGNNFFVKLDKAREEYKRVHYDKKLAAARANSRNPANILKESKRGKDYPYLIGDEKLRILCEKISKNRHNDPLYDLAQFVIQKNLLKYVDEKFVSGLENLSRYHGDWVNPLEDWKVRRGGPGGIIGNLARHLIVKYHVPKFLYWHLDNELFFRWFYELANGTSVRKLYKFPIELTKKQANLFLQAPEEYSPNWAIRYAQIIDLGGDTHMCTALAGTRASEDWANNEFWMSVIRFFVKNPMLDTAQYGPIIDYLTAMKFGINGFPAEQPGLSMHRREAGALMMQVEGWHRRLGGNLNVPKGTPPQWPHHEKIEDFVYVSKRRVNPNCVEETYWTINQICTARELRDEGTTLSHCVWTYIVSCARGDCSIWSLKKEGKSLITVEVRGTSVRQIRGKHNRHATDEEYSVIAKWETKNNLTRSSWV